jgi:hypothetical protein
MSSPRREGGDLAPSESEQVNLELSMYANNSIPD